MNTSEANYLVVLRMPIVRVSIGFLGAVGFLFVVVGSVLIVGQLKWT